MFLHPSRCSNETKRRLKAITIDERATKNRVSVTYDADAVSLNHIRERIREAGYEPTETESRESLDEVIDIFVKLHQLAHQDPGYLNGAPHKCPISRPDEVQAARNPILRYEPEE